jgi:hypothetical protein
MESLTSLAPGDFSVSGVAGKRERGAGLAAGGDVWSAAKRSNDALGT